MSSAGSWKHWLLWETMAVQTDRQLLLLSPFLKVISEFPQAAGSSLPLPLGAPSLVDEHCCC